MVIWKLATHMHFTVSFVDCFRGKDEVGLRRVDLIWYTRGAIEIHILYMASQQG